MPAPVGGKSPDQIVDEVVGLCRTGTYLEALALSRRGRELIESGADLNVREPAGGSSPLISAATFGQAEAARRR